MDAAPKGTVKEENPGPSQLAFKGSKKDSRIVLGIAKRGVPGRDVTE